MTFLPIVTRELRVSSRRAGTYWLRTLAALTVIVVGTWFFLMMRTEQSQEIAMVLFGILTGSAVLYCLLSGVRSTADSLSEEKREGTLGLLFLTDLRGYDVVFGKLVASSLSAFYGVLAIVPVLGIPLLMGGVTLGEFGRMALVALNTMFFSLAIGICVSAISKGARQARGATFLLIMLFAALLPICGSWQFLFGRSRVIEVVLMLPSPGFAYYLAWDIPFKARADDFWKSICVIHGLAWLFLAGASLLAPRGWKDRPAGVRRLRWRDRWKLWSYGNLEERLAFRKRLLDHNAFFWLAARARLKPAFVWGVLGLITCGWVWGLSAFRRDWLNAGIYATTGVVLNLLLKGWVSSEAGRQLAEDRLHGTMELLLSTPLTVRDFLRGQFMALARQFLGPLIVVLAADIVFLLAPGRAELGNDMSTWIVFWTVMMVMLPADIVALYWVGMWQGVVAKNPQRAASGTMVRILVIPWLLLAGCSLLISLGAMASRTDLGFNFFAGMWLVIGAIVDIAFASWARAKLLTEFRIVAAQRYVVAKPLWKRLFYPDPKNLPVLPPVIATSK